MNSLIQNKNQTKAISNILLKTNDIEIISNIARGGKEAPSLRPIWLTNELSFFPFLQEDPKLAHNSIQHAEKYAGFF